FGDLMVLLPSIIGSICLLAVCVVFVRSRRFGFDGALLAVCGAALLALPLLQSAEERAVQKTASRLDRINDTLPKLEERMALLSVGRRTLGDLPGDTRAAAADVLTSAAGIGGPNAVTPTWEIEVLGGVSGDELADALEWIRKVKAERRTAVIRVEPVMPVGAADPDGQRRRLVDAAGEVIDHVYEEMNQRVDIARLVEEDVPGPRLRLGF
ncbi:MAG: hypothetical protein AAF637_27745, partial [Pseudomonadota bacterium]